MRLVAILGVLLLFPALPAPGNASPAADPEVYSATTADLSDPEAVLKAMRDVGATELSTEALTLYQQGIQAARNGQGTKAETYLETAAEMDPSFPEPHLALARIHLFSSPERAFTDLWHASRAATSSFGAQHLLLVNVVFGFFIVVALGGILTTLYAALRLLPRVHHTLSELLRRWFPPIPAAIIATVVLAAPALWRVGLVPVILLFAGIMWAWMESGDRRWAATLAGITVAAPLVLWGFSPVLYSPLDPASRPFLLNRAMSAPYSAGLVQATRDALNEDPTDADLHFALAMVEKRGHHLDVAEKAYRDALRYGAPESEVYNNLGVIAFLRNQHDQAMGLFQQAIEAGNNQAAPHYNLSQAYAKKLLFEKADQEMLEANRLSFNRIRAVLRHGGSDDENPLIDETLPASAIWHAAWSSPRRMPGLPAWMKLWFPGSLLALPLISLPLFGLGLLAGSRLHRALASFACSNCGRAVCRRCLRRIRRAAYCTSCGDALLRIQSTAYSRLVLDSRLRRNRSMTSIFPKAAAWFLPGYHASRVGHADVAAALAMGTALASMGLVHDRLPVTRLAWLENGPGLWWPGVPLVLLSVVFLVSWLTILRLHPPRRADRPDASAPSDDLPDDGFHPVPRRAA
jgi:Tfp pilus assembly protein PilF